MAIQTADDFLRLHNTEYRTSATERHFHCPICNHPYKTVEAMMACFTHPVAKGNFKVGDIVFIPGRWRNRDIDPNDPWIACRRSPKDHFDHVSQVYCWFVVTSIWQKNHTEVASVVTLGNSENMYGWNPTVEDTHFRMWKAEDVAAELSKHEYWGKHLKGIEIKMPSDALKAEAAKLAESNLFFSNLL